MAIEEQDQRFQQLFKRYIEQKDQPTIDWESLDPPHDDTVIPYSRLVSPEPSKVRVVGHCETELAWVAQDQNQTVVMCLWC